MAIRVRHACLGVRVAFSRAVKTNFSFAEAGKELNAQVRIQPFQTSFGRAIQALRNVALGC
jgi:hypothetical protein